MELLFRSCVVDLNVGGERMTTLLRTLTKDQDSMLAAMFSDLNAINKDKYGCFFIDCDGTLFKHILNYLRFGNLPPAEEALKVYDLATYFRIQSLVTALEQYQSVQHRKQVTEMKSTFDMEQYEAIKLDIINEMLKAKIDPKQNKVLHICKGKWHRSLDGFLQCISALPTMNQHKNNPPFVGVSEYHIEVEQRSAISADMQRCLAYDLCELGFGKYSYLGEFKQWGVECCFIFLLTNSL